MDELWAGVTDDRANMINSRLASSCSPNSFQALATIIRILSLALSSNFLPLSLFGFVIVDPTEAWPLFVRCNLERRRMATFFNGCLHTLMPAIDLSIESSMLAYES